MSAISTAEPQASGKSARKGRQFTAANAREMALRGVEAKKRKALQTPATVPSEQIAEGNEESAISRARTMETELQIKKLDLMMAKCKSVKNMAMLTKSKEQLWKLIWPTAGVLKPKNARDQARSPLVE